MKNDRYKDQRLTGVIRGQLNLLGEAPQVVLIESLSREGLKFRCDRGTSCRVMPAHQRTPGPIFGVTVMIVFAVPGSSTAVHVPCKVVFCHRLAQDSFCFSCEFDGSPRLESAQGADEKERHEQDRSHIRVA